jgi:hypothetical protein
MTLSSLSPSRVSHAMRTTLPGSGGHSFMKSCWTPTLMLVAMLSLAACSGGAAAPLALYPANVEGHHALVEGTLERDGECLYIVGGSGERWLAAFPSPGTTWDATRQVVRVGENAVAVGEVAAFAGGETRGDASGVQWVEPPGATCDQSGIWWVTHVTNRRGQRYPAIDPG